MDLIGYHGTSEKSAKNILTVGIREEFLPERGQIGRGFYVARMNGTLPQWGATQATAEARLAAEKAAAVARSRQSYFVRMVSLLTGEVNDPFIGDDCQRTILKIYAVRPLVGCKWNVMNPGDLHFLKRLQYDNGGPGLDLARRLFEAEWLQMVVPPEELQYLRPKRDDGIFEQPKNWVPNESPMFIKEPKNWFPNESPM